MAEVTVTTFEVEGDAQTDNVKLSVDRSALGGAVGGDTVNVAVYQVTASRAIVFAGAGVLGTAVQVEETKGDPDQDRVELPFLKSQLGAVSAFGTHTTGTVLEDEDGTVLMLPITTAAPTP